jgi:hypothetical protein
MTITAAGATAAPLLFQQRRDRRRLGAGCHVGDLRPREERRDRDDDGTEPDDREVGDECGWDGRGAEQHAVLLPDAEAPERPRQAIHLGHEHGVGDPLVFEENGGAVAAPFDDVAIEELFSGVQPLRVGPKLRERVDTLRPRLAGREVLRRNTAQLVAAGGIVPGVAGARDLA